MREICPEFVLPKLYSVDEFFSRLTMAKGFKTDVFPDGKYVKLAVGKFCIL